MSVQVGIINTWNNGKRPRQSPFSPISTKLRYQGRETQRKKHVFGEERLVGNIQAVLSDESSSKMDTTRVASLLK